MELEEPRYGTIDRDDAERLATTPPDADGPVWMVNLLKYRDRADYRDGRDDDISGAEADQRYTPIGPLKAVGAEIVFYAVVEDQLLGDDPVWDAVAVVRYPTRRAFMDMQELDEFKAAHVHKDAGLERTFVIAGVPMDWPTPGPGVTLPEWADVPHPPTDDDGPAMVVHVLRYEDGGGAASPADMEEYSRAAGAVAVPHGVRITAWFEVEGTIVGDGRGWDQVRFNLFPSKAAFMDVVLDPARLDAQKQHREKAIADTYTMITRPVIDRLADSVDD